MYQALYRTYRPEVFSEVLGQEHIVKILKNQLSSGSVTHAYLFCGTRGTGKTTIARLLAKGVNCLSEGDVPCGQCEHCRAIQAGNFVDVIEIDAASNNGVDSIRELKESVKYPPAVGRKKVYIIDEVHMLSTGAFNALLKTLEEPPENVIFILATTEPQKLPATILSRCMRLDFKRVPESIIRSGMEKICADLGIDVSESALKLIAANADGSVRDGLSILDQCLAGGEKKIERDDVLDFLGASGEEVFMEMTDDVTMGKTDQALILLNSVLAEGKEIRQFAKGWLEHYRSLLIAKFIKSPEDILNMSCENVERIRAQADRLEVADINDAILELSKTLNEAKWSTQPRVLVEIAIVKLSSGGMLMAKAMKRSEAKAPAVDVKSAFAEKSQSVGTKAQADAEPAKKEKATAEAKPMSEEEQALAALKESAEEEGFDVDLEELWMEILEDKNANGSLSILKDGVMLKSLTDNEFELECASDMKLKFVERNSAKLEELVAAHTGAHHRMVCTLKESAPAAVKDTAKDLEELLGVKVKIE